MEFIDLKSQYGIHKAEIDAAITRVLEHGQFIMGPEIKQLEEKLSEYCGAKHSITTANGTVSLEIALRSLDIGQGDEVITVPFTWISSAEVISQVGAKPVFVDIENRYFNMDANLLEAAITPRTKAIIAVSLFGQMPDFDHINTIAAKYGIVVIEDGAQSFGASQKGRKSCSVTTIATTSFFPAKPLGCYGDGGALFTDNDALALKMQAIRTHGGIQRHHHPYLGMNGRMDTLQAAILLVKLAHFESEVSARERIGERYAAALASCPCEVPKVMPGNTSVYAQYTIRVSTPLVLGAALKERDIPTAIYYPKCLHEQPVFAHLGYRLGDFPEAEKASREVLSLPMHPFLNKEDQDCVAEAIVSILAQKDT